MQLCNNICNLYYIIFSEEVEWEKFADANPKFIIAYVRKRPALPSQLQGKKNVQ